jgi:hypothetical protein
VANAAVNTRDALVSQELYRCGEGKEMVTDAVTRSALNTILRLKADDALCEPA